MLKKLNISSYERFVLYVILSFFLAISSCLLMTRPGCISESSFMLKPESRLPKWFKIPEGYEKKVLTVEIFYYGSDEGEFKAVLLGPPPENMKLSKKFGIKRLHSESQKFERGHYPAYYVGTIDGIDEVIEHRAREPFFYISDAPLLRETLKSEASN